jgi:hypothetical protein
MLIWLRVFSALRYLARSQHCTMRSTTYRGSPAWRWGLPLSLGGAALLLALNFLSGSLLLSPPPLPRLAFDSDYADLALGRTPLAPTFGVNLLAWSGALAGAEEAADFRAAYTAWRDAASAEMAGTGAYIYPFDALHITVSTPAPSTHRGHAAWAPAERALYSRAWVSALAARPCAPTRASYPLVLRAAGVGGSGGSSGGSSLRLAQHPAGAAIMLLDDPTGEIEGLRECMRAAAAALPPRVQAMLGAAGFKAPAGGLVHATIMRLALPRSAGVSDADVEERWGRAARAWDRLVAPRVDLITARGTVLVEGMEAANLVLPTRQDFVLWQSSSKQ